MNLKVSGNEKVLTFLKVNLNIQILDEKKDLFIKKSIFNK